MLVLDASLTIPLLVAEPRSPQARATLQHLRGEGQVFIAPTLWAYEVTSSIQKLRHFGVITASEAELPLNL